jgi:hypothetical protein
MAASSRLWGKFMSYDLYLWAEPQSVTAGQAGAICQRLADGDRAATASTPRLLEFAADLVTLYPPLEDLADTDGSPWTMSPDVTDRRVILCLGWSHVPTAGARILELAGRYGLVCHAPSAPMPTGILRLVTCDGRRLSAPGLIEIDRQVRGIDAVNWFAYLERDQGTYVQIGPNAGAPNGRYSLEYRDGATERHTRVFIDDIDVVAAAFRGFATGDDSWRSAHAWTEI